MLKSLLASALFAGLIAGLFAAGLQQALLVPLIAEAELYETGALIHFGAEIIESGAAAGHEIVAGTDLARSLLTVLTTVLATCGFGLILVAGFALAERLKLTRIDLRSGLLFGLAGFASIQLLPSMGLSPELPGAAAGELAQRQLWWLATVAGTAIGIALIAWGNTAAKIAGAVLIAAPHLVGAPHPHEFEGVVPPELSALFAARVLVVGALGWAALGALAGHFWSREAAPA
ncbi:MAG: CbtA family protein [Proteobacteria bacterium]|nr:CbtA family protein [Pseudomonadota bacterium]